MTEEKSINLYSTCRACLKNGTRMYPLTETIVNLNVSIASMLEFCTSTKIVLKENLPNSVCLSCYKTIRISYQFFKRFEEVQQQLLSLQDTDSISEEETLLIEVETSEDEVVQEASEGNEKTHCTDDIEQINYSENLEPENVNSQESKMEYVVQKSKYVLKNRYICPRCGIKFHRQDTFESHITQYKLKKITCTRCPKRPEFNTSEYFYHYRMIHKYQCDICDKTLSSYHRYIYHKNQHTLKLFKCSFQNCSKTFTMKKKLTKHENFHHSFKKYSCSLCWDTFKTNSALRYHLKKHDNEDAAKASPVHQK